MNVLLDTCALLALARGELPDGAAAALLRHLSSAAKHRDDFLQMAANAGIVLRITPVLQKPNRLRRSFHGSFPQLLRVRLRQAIEREDTHVLGSGSCRLDRGI